MRSDVLASFYTCAGKYWGAPSPEVETFASLTPRPADAFGANPLNPGWGAAGGDLLRLSPDGRGPDGEMSGADRPNPREISNAVSAQHGADIPNAAGASDFLWMWGQFLDHDLSLTEAGHTHAAPIPVPVGDPHFDPFGTGDATIPFTRVDPTATGYQNQVTAYIDASMIYGSDAATLAEMRVAGGKLLMVEDDFLYVDGTKVFTGDIRAAENAALLSMHTLLTREHNRMVEELAARDPSLTADELFEAARARVEAMVQAITYNEFLPLLIGEDAIAAYDGHDPAVNPQISVEFSTAVFRMGHTLLSSHLRLTGEDGADQGALALRDAFMQPGFVNANGIDSLLRGAATQHAQEFDTMVVEDVRSFLFGPPGAGGLDLASLNIHRGRDLGIASYNELREAVGLDRVTGFDQITSDAGLAARLETVYGHVDLVDAWVGGLAEDHIPGGMMGQTFAAVMVDQFTRLRDGDPYWSEGRGFSQAELDELWHTRLSDIILRNTDIEAIQTNAFMAMGRIVGDDAEDLMPGSEGADFMLGLAGDDILGGFGGDDELRGGTGKDLLYGLAGGDTLWGDAGDDVLQGGDGNDLLNGGDGDDLFDGGTGQNVLGGGAGRDGFHFDTLGAARTVVLDFDAREDALFFSNVSRGEVHLGLKEDGLTLELDADTAVVFANWTPDELVYLLELMG